MTFTIKLEEARAEALQEGLAKAQLLDLKKS